MRFFYSTATTSDEAALNQRILELLRAKLRKDYLPGTLMRRDAHPKLHGLLLAYFTVEDNLPPDLRQGLFSTAATYLCLIRLSNGFPKMQPDKVKDVRGWGLKVLNVPGRKIVVHDGNMTSQDFLLCNHPTFFIRNVEDYLKFMETTTRGSFLPFFIGWKPSEWHLYEFMKVIQATSKTVVSPLRIQYWSQTPYQLGNLEVKYSVIPRHVPSIGQFSSDSPNSLRLTAAEELLHGDAVFDFMAQVRNCPSKMPLEDSTILWPERLSPFRKVATIRIPQQTFNTEARDAFAENLSINPWHALLGMEPLGNTNRTRKVVYDGISEFRHQTNGIVRVEPTDFTGID